MISTTRRRVAKPLTAASDREEFDCHSLDRVFELATVVSLRLLPNLVSSSNLAPWVPIEIMRDRYLTKTQPSVLLALRRKIVN